MDREVDLLTSLPKPKRDVKNRAQGKDAEVIRTAKKYDKEYWDGDRKYGYGGYEYDGRWISVARDIIKFFDLKKDAKILDVGCGKGFLIYDLIKQDMDAYGLDISKYAIKSSPFSIRQRIWYGTAEKLPFGDQSFDLVLSINTLHNLPREGCIKALQEIERVCRDNSYIVVDSYHTPKQKKHFEEWVLTAETYGYPHEWKQIFDEAGYTGFYSWNIL